MATKVFVGNLSFSYTEADLAKEFEHIGEVSGAQIIMQGRRSLGYGFVEFARSEDAKTAVSEMNKKELGGREVNVEFAKAPQERPERSERNDRSRGPRGGPRSGRRQRDSGRDAGRDINRTRNNRRESGREAGRDSGERRSRNNGDNRGQRRPRPRRQKRPQRDEDRPESTTLLFVANLPWEYENEDLESLFEGLSLKEARVVKTPTGRSRGYGFVEFEDQKAQLAALAKVDGTTVDGKNGERTISVKVALQASEESKPEETNEKDEKEEAEPEPEATEEEGETEAETEPEAEPKQEENADAEKKPEPEEETAE